MTLIKTPFIISLFALGFIASPNVNAQVQLRGKVTDAATSKPIAGAIAFINYLPLRSSADTSGTFILRNIPKGNVELFVMREGYEPFILKTKLENPVYQIPIKLSPEASKTKKTISPKEKIYLHTDKPYYYPGEMIWFSGYVNYNIPAKRDSLSSVAYVDLLDGQNKVVSKSIIPIDSGRMTGQIRLPKDLKPGQYLLQAYTTYMLNFGESGIFYKSIPVMDIFESVDLTEAARDQRAVAADAGRNVELTADKSSYKQREKINITLKLPDELTAATFSITVTDTKQVIPIAEAQILHQYDFDPSASEEPERLNYPVEYGVNFLGDFKNSRGKPTMASINFIRDEFKDFFIGQTDETGRIFVNGLHFYDSATFYYRATSGNKKVEGLLEVQTLPQLQGPASLPGFWFRTKREQNARAILPGYLLPDNVKVLEEVVVEAKKNDPEAVYNKLRLGNPDHEIKMEDLNIMGGNLLMALRGRVPGLVINCSGGADCTVAFSRAMGTSIMGDGEPLVVVDGSPRAGNPGQILSTIDPSSLYKIEFTKRINVLYGAQGANGVIAVYTKSGVGIYDEAQKTKQFFKLRGYTSPMPFKTPDYSKQTSDTDVDYRATIYWNPNVKLDERKKTQTLSFFAADIPADYRILIEGVTAEGKPVRLIKFINVQ
jgi:hypothetical protein